MAEVHESVFGMNSKLLGACQASENRSRIRIINSAKFF
jgi:hypothetical protein